MGNKQWTTTEVHIPFEFDMRVLVLNGKKTCTTRTKRYGKRGDTFRVGDEIFVLTEVKRMPLEKIVNTLYKEEGFSNPEAFKEYLAKLDIPLEPTTVLWVHRFKKCNHINVAKNTTLDKFNEDKQEVGIH